MQIMEKKVQRMYTVPVSVHERYRRFVYEHNRRNAVYELLTKGLALAPDLASTARVAAWRDEPQIILAGYGNAKTFGAVVAWATEHYTIPASMAATHLLSAALTAEGYPDEH
jgi:hypothetical protein